MNNVHLHRRHRFRQRQFFFRRFRQRFTGNFSATSTQTAEVSTIPVVFNERSGVGWQQRRLFRRQWIENYIIGQTNP